MESWTTKEGVSTNLMVCDAQGNNLGNFEFKLKEPADLIK